MKLSQILNQRWNWNQKRWIDMYRCSKCKDQIRGDTNIVGIQCSNCGSKIFYKERPNVKKSIQAR